jgi:hypothetical protein
MAAIRYRRLENKQPHLSMTIDARFTLVEGEMSTKEFGDKTLDLHRFFNEHAADFEKMGLNPNTITLTIRTL